MPAGRLQLVARGNGPRQAPLSKRQKKTVKRLISNQIEKKFFDFNAAATGIDAAGVAGDISAVTVASSATTSGRDGTSIMAKELRVNFQIISSDATNQVRVIVFQWKQSSAGNPIITADVLQQVAFVPPMAQTAWDNVDDGSLHVMYDKCFQVATGAGTPIAITKRLIFRGRKLGTKRLDFDAGGTTGHNHYIVFFISDSAAASHPTVAQSHRLIYTDA